MRDRRPRIARSGSARRRPNRLLLLRREALELALYTFHYIHGVENVLAILPPGRSQTTSTLTRTLPTSDSPSVGKPLDIGVLFDHQELAPLLKLPLTLTLPEQPLTVVADPHRAGVAAGR